MTAHKLGNELCRLTQLFGRNRSSWKHFGTQALGSRVPLKAQLQEERSCVRTGQQKVRPVVGFRMRFYSQEGAGLQGQSESKGPPCSSQNTVDSCSLSDEDRSSVPECQERSLKPFYDQLKMCKSPTDVLDVVDKYTLTWRRVSNSLTHIWGTTKKMSDEQKRYELQLMFEHPVFEELCRKVILDAPRMRNDDVAFCLLALVKLGVSQRSRVVQTLLRVIQEKLNEFDEKALSVVANCMEDMESNKNANALKAGLRLLVAERVSGMESVVTLQGLMRCVGRDAPVSLKRKLETKALSMAEQFSLPNAQYMFTSLAAMNYSSKTLLDICSSKIVENIHCIPFTRLTRMLKACKELHYRDHRLFSAIAEYLVSTFDIWSNKQLVLVLLLFEELGFRPVALMDKFSEKVIQDSHALLLKDVLSVLKVYSLLNYVPQQHTQVFLETVTQVLESYLPKMAPTELLRGVFFLCVLEHFPLAPFQRLQQREVLEERLGKDGRFLQMNQQRLHYVNLCLHLDRPSLLQDLVIPPSAGLPPSNRKLVNLGLVKTLQGIVGSGAVQEGVLMENGYFIDCLITLPLEVADLSSLSDGEPVTQESSQRVALLCAPESAFCMGTCHPRGMLAMKMRHLRGLGYSPVLVPEQELHLLPEEERATVLRNLIFGVKEEAVSINSEEVKT